MPAKFLRLLKVGISGKFASGKSEVLKVFADSGFAICSADDIAHGLLEKGNPIAGRVMQVFGSAISDEQGAISRKKLGELVFNSESAMAELESITHPAIKSGIEDFLADNPLCAAENALLFKMNMGESFDKLVLVRCPEELRRSNIAARGISPERADRISFFQKDEFYSPHDADFVIENNSSLAGLRAGTEKLLASLYGVY